MEHEETLCYEVETVREFSYLGDKVSASERCEAAMTVRTRCGWVKFTKCGELSISYIRPATLHGSKVWCMK